MKVLAFAFVFTLACGCVDTRSPDAQGAKPGGLFVLDDGGLHEVDKIPGLSRTDSGAWSWKPLEGMVEDSIRILAFQMLADAGYRTTELAALENAPSSGFGEAEPVDVVCTFIASWHDAPGEFFLRRGMGGTSAYPDAPFSGSVGGSTGNGGGGSRNEGSGSGTLEEGEWQFFFEGLAGYDPALAEGEWTISFEVDAPVRVIELPSAPFFCGFGFSTLPGASSTPAPVPYTAGGELRIDGIYGARFHFCPGFDPLSNDATALFNKAEVDFDGNVASLSPVVKTALDTGARAAVTLTNQQWFGSPSWYLQGLFLTSAPINLIC